MRTLDLIGLAWEDSRLYYLRQSMDSEDLVTQLCRRSFGDVEYFGRSGYAALNQLIIEALSTLGEADTATIAIRLCMNQKTAHRRLSHLYHHGRVKMRRVRGFFLWTAPALPTPADDGSSGGSAVRDRSPSLEDSFRDAGQAAHDPLSQNGVFDEKSREALP